MVIYGPSDNIHYDEDLGPIILGDWYHTPSHELLKQAMGYAPPGVSLPLPRSSNSLINGRNSVSALQLLMSLTGSNHRHSIRA